MDGDMDAVELEVVHETHYAYAAPVSVAHHLAHLRPLDDASQRLLMHELAITPAPDTRRDGTDSFGNPCLWFGSAALHDSLQVCSTSRVRLLPRFAGLRADGGPAWDRLAAGLRYVARAPFEPALEFSLPSPYVPRLDVLRDWAAPTMRPGRPVAAVALELMDRVHAEFSYRSASTQVDTPLAQAFQQRAGVCQDFAHLMIAALRSIGLPARYMSGYLLTDPPPGKPRLVGADASHAWVAVWCPGHGWIEYDPTNGIQPDLRHVTLGWGCDFQDVSPLRGVILGGLAQAPEVRVTVMPEAEWIERQAQLAKAKPHAKAPPAPEVEEPEA